MTWELLASSLQQSNGDGWGARVSPEILEQLSGRQKSQHHLRRRRAAQNERRSPLAKFLAASQNDDEFKNLKNVILGIDENDPKRWKLLCLYIF